jgi:hypothetical protein
LGTFSVQDDGTKRNPRGRPGRSRAMEQDGLLQKSSCAVSFFFDFRRMMMMTTHKTARTPLMIRRRFSSKTYPPMVAARS